MITITTDTHIHLAKTSDTITRIVLEQDLGMSKPLEMQKLNTDYPLVLIP